MIATIFLLLVIFQLKHLVADYFLQGKYMLGKFRPGWDFLGPLLAHVGVHGAFTLAIALAFGAGWLAPLLALGDMAVHFTMDRIKAGPKYLGRFKPDQKQFWWSLGVDQSIHHLTHYWLIWMLIFL